MSVTQGSSKSYHERSLQHPHPVAKRLFQVAELKKSNLVISADLTETKTLLGTTPKPAGPRQLPGPTGLAGRQTELRKCMHICM